MGGVRRMTEVGAHVLLRISHFDLMAYQDLLSRHSYGRSRCNITKTPIE